MRLANNFPPILVTTKKTLNRNTMTTSLKKKRRVTDSFIRAFLAFCGMVSILTTVGIVFELGKEAWLFFGILTSDC